MKKKMLSLLLAGSLLLGTLAVPASAAELPFGDVPEKAWYREAVTYVYENGLFQGNSATQFAPDAPMTRAMFVQVLANKTGNYSKADWAGKSSFSDVRASAWYAAPIQWASKAGLVSGVGNGRFEPETNVSREEMAVILYNYAKKTGNDASLKTDALTGFSDAFQVASWAKEPMQWAVTHGVVKGSGGKIDPKSNAKRCEVAQVFTNAAPLLVKNEVEADLTEDPNDGKFATMEELVGSELVQNQLNSLKASLEGTGMELSVSGKGNRLIYQFFFPAGIDTTGLAGTLETAVNAQAATFTGLAAAMQNIVAVDDPVVAVIYADSAGNPIYSREFRASK